MGVRKAVDDVVGVVVAAGAVPVVDACVGRELDHAERHRRTGKRVPVPAGTDKRIHPPRVITRLGKDG